MTFGRFRVGLTDRVIRGGLVGIINNLLDYESHRVIGVALNELMANIPT